MQPLKGITVVALEHAIAAPFATRQLADLGARVIKVERPGVGDFARGYDQRVRGLASHFVWTNRSKESLTLDVKHPQAAALLQRLIVEKAESAGAERATRHVPAGGFARTKARWDRPGAHGTGEARRARWDKEHMARARRGERGGEWRCFRV